MMRAKRCQFIITKNEVRQCWSGPFEILCSYVFLLLGQDFLSQRYLCYATNSANLLSLAYIVHGYQHLLWVLISCTFPFVSCIVSLSCFCIALVLSLNYICFYMRIVCEYSQFCSRFNRTRQLHCIFKLFLYCRCVIFKLYLFLNAYGVFPLHSGCHVSSALNL